MPSLVQRETPAPRCTLCLVMMRQGSAGSRKSKRRNNNNNNNKIRVVSYNVHGLRVGHSAADKTRRLVVDALLDECDILRLQETWLAKQDLDKLNALHKDFHGAGESTTDLSTNIARGRIPGGVAILWNRKYDPRVTVVRLNVDWAILG